MASTPTPAPAMHRRLLPLSIACATVLLVAGCESDAADTLPADVARELRTSLGVTTDVACTAVGGGEPVAEHGARFTCTATSPEMDGTIEVEGAFVSTEHQRSRPVGGTGTLGAIAGYVDPSERP